VEAHGAGSLGDFTAELNKCAAEEQSLDVTWNDVLDDIGPNQYFQIGLSAFTTIEVSNCIEQRLLLLGVVPPLEGSTGASDSGDGESSTTN